MIKAVLFDLDGTLLPMDQDEFTGGYFKMVAAKMAPRGYDTKELIKNIWGGTAAMVKNDGHCMNEEAFWEFYTSVYGPDSINDKPIFDDFYANEFEQVRSYCGYTPRSKELIELVKSRYRVALATNPLFPAVATHSRIRWAGLEPDMFELITTYENIGYCKPNPKYYLEILRRMALNPEECLMIGNDTDEDMIAETIGMNVYLLTDCMINRKVYDIEKWPHGSFDDLMTYIRSI
ncbi:MAG: HAD family hydrolase [Lachnospiraceae bacterium]|nr:HAD family hydrolase [Lachnospiraceae bacterium]